MLNFLINNYNIILINYSVVLGTLFVAYLSASLMVYILSFLVIIINLSFITFCLGWEFVSLWLLIIYGGSVIMFIIIISMLCRIEFQTQINAVNFKDMFRKQLICALCALLSRTLVFAGSVGSDYNY